MCDHQKYPNKYAPSRGFNGFEKKEYDQVLGDGCHIDTKNDTEYQKRLFNLMRRIIDNDKLDYISKLDKLSFLIDLNKSYKSFWEERESQATITVG